MQKSFYRLIFITNKNNAPTESYLKFIETCIKGGVTSVQLREKSLSQEALFQFGCLLKSLLDFNNIPLIINDNVPLCLKLDAAGVHLGQSDLDITKARAALGTKKIIGLSVNTLQHVDSSKLKPIDYIGLGAIFPTDNKPDIETIWGLEGLKQASLKASHPLVAIGGIKENNARSVMNAGANGIAAIGAFHNAKDPLLTSRNLINIINGRNDDR